MKSLKIILVLAAMSALFAAPASYNVKKIDGWTPVVDGSMSEWPGATLVDTIQGDNNVFARTSLTPWAADEMQMAVYAAYDAQKVYFAVRVLSDNSLVIGNAVNGDNIKVNPGGQAMGFYISANGVTTLNPSCPFTLNSSLVTAMSVNGLPVYEFSLNRNVLDPFCMGSFQLSIGSEDRDADSSECYLAIGANYTGNKQAWTQNPWDNPLYFPTFNLRLPVYTAYDNNSNARVAVYTHAAVSSPDIAIHVDSSEVENSDHVKITSVQVEASPELLSVMDSARITVYWDSLKSKIDDANLALYYLNNGEWELVNGSVTATTSRIVSDSATREVVAVIKTVTVTVYHFSVYGLFAPVNSTAAEVKGANLSYLGLNAMPNPITSSTVVSYNVEKNTQVSLRVYSVSGKMVRELVSGHETAGAHNVSWNGMDNSGKVLPSGLYMVKLSAGNKSLTRAVTLMR